MKSEFLNDCMELRSKVKINNTYMETVNGIIQKKYKKYEKHLKTKKQHNSFMVFDHITQESIKMKIEA